ncbi:MAG: O-methyltransferase [Actinomycetota bacterium]
MSDDVYTEVDEYLEGLFGPSDPVLDEVLERCRAAGLPPIQVSATHGRLLHVLALARGAASILEIGTLGGYSTIWLARALPPGGRLISLEYEPRHAEVARENLTLAGLSDVVEVRVGRGLELLDELVSARTRPFDLVFIDADKAAYAQYLTSVLRLTRPGTLIVADNVVRKGEVVHEPVNDESVAGLQRFNAALAGDERLAAAFIQQVGIKGHDGMALAVVRSAPAG